MRKYEELWLQIKKTNSASLLADPSMHYRIVKALTKEKRRDLSFNLSVTELGKTSWLSNDSQGERLTFTLNISINVEDL